MARPEDRLNQARQALRGSYLHALRRLHVEQYGDSLVITGQVTTYYQKQMAQEIIRAVCDDVELHNSVDVHDGKQVGRTPVVRKPVVRKPK